MKQLLKFLIAGSRLMRGNVIFFVFDAAKCEKKGLETFAASVFFSPNNLSSQESIKNYTFPLAFTSNTHIFSPSLFYLESRRGFSGN